MKIKTYGCTARDAAPTTRVIDGWFLNCCDLPFARSVPIPNFLRPKDGNRILAMLEKVARDFERKEELDVQPIPPVRESPRSHGGRSIAFDGQKFPLTAKFCPDRTEGAKAFVMRMEKLANRQPGPAERAYWVGLLHYSGSLRRDAQVGDMDAGLIENALENLTRTQI